MHEVYHKATECPILYGRINSWSQLGTGIGGGAIPRINALSSFGTELIAGGSFTQAGGLGASNIAGWDGNAWHALQAGTDGTVMGLHAYVGEVVALGSFATAGGEVSAYFARWRLACPSGDANCDGTIDVLDINPFILALSSPTEYLTQYPSCDIANSDTNGDGSINVLDINPFIALLVGP